MRNAITNYQLSFTIYQNKKTTDFYNIFIGLAK